MKKTDDKDIKTGETSDKKNKWFAGKDDSDISDIEENMEIPVEEKGDVFVNGKNQKSVKETDKTNETSKKEGWFQEEVASKNNLESSGTESFDDEIEKTGTEINANQKIGAINEFADENIGDEEAFEKDSKVSSVDDKHTFDSNQADKDSEITGKVAGDGEIGEDDGSLDETLDKEKEYTVNTTTFYDQYAGEINAYMEEAPGMDEMDEGPGDEVPEHWLHKPKKRRKKHYLLKFIILMIVMAGSFLFAGSSYFSINQIDVEGNVNHSKSEIVKMSGIKIGENTFKISARSVKKKLWASPYISDVDLSRSLPKKITIRVKERMVTACIQNGKTYLMVDEHFVMLKEVKKPLKMTTIEGVKVKSAKVGEEISVTDKDKLNTAGRLLTAMRKADFFFKKIDVSGSIIKIYIYDKLICKGESRYLLKHIENKNLEKILYNLYKNKIKKGSIIISNDEYCSYNPKVN